MSFGGMYFTNKGRALQAKAQIGTQLKFTRIAVGDGSLSGQQIQDMTFLIHEVKSLQITKIKTLPDGKATIGGVLSNQGIQTGFYWRELGLYAQDPDLGEILYCYGNANTLAEYIPAQGGADILEKQINIVAIIGNAANVTASINQSLIYASQADMDNKVDKVTGKQLSTEDYTTTEKQKLAGLSNYVHPDTHPSTMIVMGDGSSLEQYKSSVSSQMADNTKLFISGALKDSNGNELIKTTATASAVNEVTIKNNTTGNAPQVQATGDDVNVNLNLIPKGTGRVQENGVSLVKSNDYIANNAYAVTSGTLTAYTATLNPAPTAYTDGMQITINPHVDCGVTPTLNVNGLGALTIVKQDGTATAAGDIKANKPLSLVRVGSNFFIRSSPSSPYKIGGTISDENLSLVATAGVSIFNDSSVAYGNALAVDNSYIYVTYSNGTGNKYMQKLPNSGGIALWSLSDYGYPQAIAVDSLGNIFIGHGPNGTNALRKLNSSGVEQWHLNDVTNVSGLAIDPSDNLLVVYSNSTGKTVRKLDTNGSEIWSNSDVANANGVATDSSGNVYVAYSNSSGTTVRKLNSSGIQVWANSAVGWALKIAVDSSNNVVVTHSNSEYVRKLNNNGNEIWNYSYWTNPFGVAVDKNGYIYVAYSASCSLIRLTPSGTITWYNADYGTGRFIAVDSNLNYYITYNNSSGTTLRKGYGANIYNILN